MSSVAPCKTNTGTRKSPSFPWGEIAASCDWSARIASSNFARNSPIWRVINKSIVALPEGLRLRKQQLRVLRLLPQPIPQRLVRDVQITRGKKLIQMGIHKNRRSIIMRLVWLAAAVRKFSFAGSEKSRNAREVVVCAHQQQRSNMRLITRIGRRQQRKPTGKTHSDDGHRSRAQPLLKPCGRFSDRGDRCGVHMIIGERRDLRSQHGKTALGSRACKALQARFVDSQMMNAVNDDHPVRMSNATWQIKARAHRAVRQGKHDLLRFDGIGFPAQKQARGAGIQKVNQHGITAKIEAQAVQARHRERDYEQTDTPKFTAVR